MYQNLTNKVVVLLVSLFMISGLTACSHNSSSGTNQANLPQGAKAAISFQGKSIILLNKKGKPVKPSTIDTSKGRVLSKATIELIKVNPCVMKWCPSSGDCITYVYEQLESCPSWW